MIKTNILKIEYNQIIEELKKINSDTILFVADHQVWSIYGKDFNFEELTGKKVIFWKAADGEKAKNFNDFQNCLEFFLDKGIHRNAHMVAFGGGAVSDFAGFVAATILRGIDWSIIPTTLLSMVDASIGGKVAINAKVGKNLIGAFHMPTNIYISESFLKTLPDTEMKSGMGEVLKYCFLDFGIYDLAMKKSDRSELIRACAEYKQKLTLEDFKETGIRKTLNLGHSFGHALEFIYNIPHGDAISWGMVLVFKLFGNEKNIHDITALKEALEMTDKNPPWQNKEFPVEKIMTYLSKDKKISALNSLDLILVNDIGNAVVVNKTFEEIQNALELNKDELRKFSL
ncbi:MAG: 3-dehydroquinate synthase [Bacteriovoracaceae bacterium]|nr:3-dehydroquinate synthase [Bacteriovoracaceae bacterium]